MSSYYEHFAVVVLDRFFSFGVYTKKVVVGRMKQVVILYSNNCMGIGLHGLSTGHLRLVIVL